MNIVLDNIIYSKEKQGGITNVFFELTNYLQNQKGINIKYVEEKNASLNYCRKELNINESDIIKHKSNNSLFLSRLLPINLKIEENFLYHSSYFRKISGPKNFKEITTIYDFVHDYYAPFINRKIHNNLKFGAVKRSDGIICISNNTYKDLKKFCSIKPHQKVEVIHCGVSKDYFKLTNEEILNGEYLNINNIKDKFILYVGSRAKYKNFDFVINLLRGLKDFNLVVVGQQFSDKEKKKYGQAILPRVTVLSGVNNIFLNLLYNKAFALMYPSDYEGFGIPVIEAMQAGCPVIALNKSSIPEVAGDAGILLDDLNFSIFQKKIALLENKDYHEEMVIKGLMQAKKFSWEKCCKETLDFYNEVYF
jgi:glycosyltransferase involved in cell wall biosynthesis